ncbi:MerR family transcriptional regulator [Actinocrinis puniceicyclus]|uniref:MerR family transcriptional regulator n=1 Tax=Actinocrinis puniceicyclus TaxID=977794 RepID=A0A8J7WQD2_9ACTN|nr:MerR family transcriptional regulator [Actinocrinis puniceicyclus]MBS2963992.1 MerR family transcriptional regulator [Actinocrinis puniceicyclus]
MEDRAARRLLTIGELSELTGVPVRTIRFYSDTRVGGAALVETAGRSASGYRLYAPEAAARLELVRTLRDLDIDLPTIAKVLAREVSVAEVARAHAQALEATVRVLRLRQAVLRAVAVRGSDWTGMELMHRLAKLDAAERRRILDAYLEKVFGGLDERESGRGDFEQMMRCAFPDLPEEPSARQVEAWVELVSLIQDEDFVASCRRMAEHGAAKRARMSDEQWQRDQAAFGGVLVAEAIAAYGDGVDPLSAQGRERVGAMVARWAEASAVSDGPEARAALLESLEVFLDRRVNRFWELVAIVAGRTGHASQGAPSFESMEWLVKALRAVL